MDAEQIKEKLVKYEKQYFGDFKKEGLPGYVAESVAGCFVVICEDMDGLAEYKGYDITFCFKNTEKSTLLHEMTHFYYDWLPCSEVQYTAIRKAEELRRKIANYEQIVKEFFAFRQDFNYGMIEDRHDLAFFLASLSLDLRCSYRPGTVYGYGLADEFAEKGVKIRKK